MLRKKESAPEAADLRYRVADLWGPRRLPKAASVEASVEVLDKMLGRLLEASRALDTRAAFIPPLFAAVAALGADRIAPRPWPDAATVAAAVLLIAATGAILFALRCLWAGGYKAGPNAVEVALNTHRSLADHRQGIANALAEAVMSVERLVISQGRSLNVALSCTAIAAASAVVFSAAGGLK